VRRHTVVRTVRPVSTDPRQTLGRQGEQHALDHLRRLGYDLVEANHRTRFGEIDLVMLDEDALVFVEVKSRRAHRPAAVWDALDDRKRRQVRRMARAYLHDHSDRPTAAAIRFDAVGVVMDARGGLLRLDHLEAAF
jgi:putative endonuclease